MEQSSMIVQISKIQRAKHGVSTKTNPKTFEHVGGKIRGYWGWGYCEDSNCPRIKSKILIGLGSMPGGKDENEMEVINFAQPFKRCKSVGQYPFKTGYNAF